MSHPSTTGPAPVALLALGVAGLLAPAVGALLLARAVAVLSRSLAGDRPPLDPVLGLAACGLCGLLLAWWVLGVTLATWAALTPQAARAHGVAAHLAERLAPRLARRTVAALVGAVVVAGVAAPATAQERPRPAQSLAAGTDLRTWSADRPAAPAEPASRQTGRRAPEVVVRAGDTLWEIAARALGPGAEPRRVDRYWRRWYAANRPAIGPDPDLLHPGLRLRAPDPPGPPR